MDEASREIRSTRRIIFVGYSFADADVHIKALFRKNIAPNTEIWVVNPDLKPEQKSGYDALANSVRYVSKSFEAFLDDHTLRQNLLAQLTPPS